MERIVPDDIRTSDSEAADKILATGLRNRWYCIAPSALAADKPVPLTRLGEKIVLWRDGEGKARVMQDRCPHRNAALSKCFVQNGLLTWGSHWLQIDHAGCVAAVPGFFVESAGWAAAGADLSDRRALPGHLDVFRRCAAPRTGAADDAGRTHLARLVRVSVLLRLEGELSAGVRQPRRSYARAVPARQDVHHGL